MHNISVAIIDDCVNLDVFKGIEKIKLIFILLIIIKYPKAGSNMERKPTEQFAQQFLKNIRVVIK